MFADDSAIFTETDAEATDTMYDITCTALSCDMKISVDKTKVMPTDGCFT